MRFALQDRTPEHDLGRTMLDGLAGGRRHRAVRVGLDLRPLLSDLLRPHRSVPRGVGRHHRAGPGHPAAPGRRARHRQPLPPPGRAGQHGGHARRHLGRPARARHRRRLEPGGVRRATASTCRRSRSGSTASTRRSRSSRSCSRETESNFDGQHYRCVDARCEPKPVQQPHPPICIGGGGEKRTLRSAARYAQHWNVPGRLASRSSATSVEVLEQHCADIGRDPSEIMTSTHLRFDGEDVGGLGGAASAEWQRRGPRPRHRLPPAAAHARRPRTDRRRARRRSPG